MPHLSDVTLTRVEMYVAENIIARRMSIGSD